MLDTDSPAEVFSVPTSVYVRHEAFVSVPWFFKRYFLFQKHLPKPASVIVEAEDYHRDDKVKA
jgi:hypothetical protein